jgi:SAM-dependent methyltransferase
MAGYTPTSYWEGLLGEHLDERGVAYPELAITLNRSMYAALLAAVERLLRDHGLGGPPGRVLDVGSGTGIWIDFWRRRQARDLVGLDLTNAAVAGLRERYPDLRFEQADVGDDRLPVDGPFDLVSAMSVLLHITDDERWRRAIANLAGVLRPGGHLVLIEPVVVHGWWGPPFGPDASSKARPLAEYEAAFAAAGLSLVQLRPATVLLANPIDARSRLTFDLLSRAWMLLHRAVGLDERRGRVAGAALQALDGPLRRLLPAGPTAKLLLLRRG